MQVVRIPELAHVTELSPGTLAQGIQGGERQLSDEELVFAAQNGNSHALGELFGRHQKMLYNLARRYVANSEEAHDLVQETMLRAWRNIGSFRGESRFASWLGAIVINAALCSKRREKHIQWICIDEREAEENRFCIKRLQDVRRNPEQTHLYNELRRVLQREIQRLHPKYRLVLQAYVFDESSIEQVAHSLGITPSAAKSRLHRGRRSLSAALRSSGSGCARVYSKGRASEAQL
jgi:RNA polymerase sigma-70 factor (ECF subfamily)